MPAAKFVAKATGFDDPEGLGKSTAGSKNCFRFLFIGAIFAVVGFISALGMEGTSMRLTDAQIRCLLALLSLTRLGGAIASKDVSKVLGVSRPSVHRMLENLGNSGLTEKKPYGAVKLTEAGLHLAEELEARRDRLLLLFARRFGLSMDESALAATLLLSGLNEESLSRLEAASQAP